MPAQTIDALVLLVVAVIALAGCDSTADRRSEGSAPATEQSQPTRPNKQLPQAAPDTSIPVVPVDVEFTHFASPSGNIACVITSSGDSELVARGVRCDIDKRDWSPPPRPADCELDYGHGVVLGVGEAAQLLCAGDTTIGRDSEPLVYGDAITAGPLRARAPSPESLAAMSNPVTASRFPARRISSSELSCVTSLNVRPAAPCAPVRSIAA